MASIEEIKKRRSTVNNIHKTTKAMELVSIAKTKKFQKQLFSARTFKDSIYGIIKKILEEKEIQKSELFQDRSITGKTLWVIITSDMGLCGSYNSNIFKIMKSLPRSEKDIFIIKGIKGINGFKSKLNITANIQYERINETDYIQISKEIEKETSLKFLNSEVDCVKIVWTKYINQISQIPVVSQLLPLTPETFEELDTTNINMNNHSIIEFEPSIKEVLKRLIPQYMVSTIYSSLVESTLSEYSSRRMAMENAKNNGEELIELLGIQYNKARQQKITQELTEIIAGSEAEKEE